MPANTFSHPSHPIETRNSLFKKRSCLYFISKMLLFIIQVLPFCRQLSFGIRNLGSQRQALLIAIVTIITNVVSQWRHSQPAQWNEIWSATACCDCFTCSDFRFSTVGRRSRWKKIGSARYCPSPIPAIPRPHKERKRMMVHRIIVASVFLLSASRIVHAQPVTAEMLSTFAINGWWSGCDVLLRVSTTRVPAPTIPTIPCPWIPLEIHVT